MSSTYQISPIVLTLFLTLRLSGQLPGPPISPPQIELQVLASGFVKPVDITHAGDERLFIVEQDGRIRIMDTSGVVVSTPFLDINPRVGSGGSEQGLLGLAFPPNYASDGRFYVNYTGNDGDTRISRFSVTSDPNIADPLSEEVLLLMDQPYSNHNGGCLKFGPDSMLYIGTGDGGLFGDPGNRSQSKTSLLGKMLRIDVRGSGSYAVPSDNPYAASADTLPEIWQFGLRNPWRFSFDRATDELWIADVGQDDWEEINLQSASSPGGENWGWRCYEGEDTYNTTGCGAFSDYDAPVFVYSHVTGGFSVTGGFVYRGNLQPNLIGHYILADYVTGRWWTIQRNPCNSELVVHALGNIRTLISSFGESVDGELFCCNLSTGQIYRVEEACSSLNFSLSYSPLPIEGFEFQVDGNPGVSYAWYVNDTLYCEPQSGTTDSTLSVPLLTEFSVGVDITMADGCVIRIPSVTVNAPSGVSTPYSASDWTVFPQPASDQLFWEGIPGSEGGTLIIANTMGQVIAKQYISASLQLVRNEWKTADWASGTYFMIWKPEAGLMESRSIWIGR